MSVTTPSHPTTFGFESGVIPPEFTTNDTDRSSVVAVSSLASPLNYGTTSGNAYRFAVAPGGGGAYLTLRFYLSQPISTRMSFKVAAKGAQAAIRVYTTNQQVASFDGDTVWTRVDIDSSSGFAQAIEIDFQTTGSDVPVEFYVTDLEVTGGAGGYVDIAATTGSGTGGGTGGGGTGGGLPTPVAGTYNRGEMARYSGATWLCLADGTTTAPVEGPKWAKVGITEIPDAAPAGTTGALAVGPFNTLTGPGLWIQTDQFGQYVQWWFDDHNGGGGSNADGGVWLGPTNQLTGPGLWIQTDAEVSAGGVPQMMLYYDGTP